MSCSALNKRCHKTPLFRWDQRLPHRREQPAQFCSRAILYHQQGKDDSAKPLYLRAIEIVEKTWGKKHAFILTYLISYSNFLRDINKNREALIFENRIKAIKLKDTRKRKKKKRE